MASLRPVHATERLIPWRRPGPEGGHGRRVFDVTGPFPAASRDAGPSGSPAACFACVLALAVSPLPAQASAWGRQAGTGFLAFGAEASGGAQSFGRDGRLAPTRSYAKTEGAAYAEYGVTDTLMFVARPSFDLVGLGAPAGGRYRGLGSTALGAQYEALVYGPAVLAVQGSVALPGTASRANPAAVGNTAREADLRGLAGLAFAVGPYPAFLDLQQAYRFRSGGAAAQWHSDVTIGFRPAPRLLLMALSTTVVPLGPGTPWFPRSRSSKLGFEGVYDLTAAWSLAHGASTTVYGRGALLDRGVSASLWYRF